MPAAGRLRHRVTLDDGTPAGSVVTYSPAKVWAEVRPLPPTAFDENRVRHEVLIRHHAQVSHDTRITLQDGRQLYVRGMQNVDERNIDLVLLCEEVVTPA